MKAVLTKKIPDIFPRLKEVFGVSFESGVAITVAPYVHCIYADKLIPSFVAHEQTHVDQQYVMGVDKWWDKYIADPEFRLSQEIEAYQIQYRHLRENTDLTTRQERKAWYKKMATDLSSSMYGNIISFDEAMARITE